MKTKVSYRIENEIEKQLQEAAKQQGKNISTLVREVLTVYLRDQKEEKVFRDTTPIEEKITGLIREEMKKIEHIVKSQIFNRLASLTVKSFLYSAAARKNTNYLISRAVKDEETANQLIDKGWTLAVDSLTKGKTVALFLTDENYEKLKELGKDDISDFLNEKVKEWLLNQEQKTPLTLVPGE